MKLEEYLNQFWATTILKLDFDLKKRCIEITLQISENGEERVHVIKFHKIESFYYAMENGTQSDLFDQEPWEKLELSSIEFLDSECINIDVSSVRHDWIRNFCANANFIIEIWDSYLLLKSSKVEIDEHVFIINN
jgi:hypothetical protein